MIADAKVEEDPRTAMPVIALHLTDEGREIFAAATRAHVGERLGVVVDGVVASAPLIIEPIIGGRVQISGNFTSVSAAALVKVILPRAGHIPLTIVEGDTAR